MKRRKEFSEAKTDEALILCQYSSFYCPCLLYLSECYRHVWALSCIFLRRLQSYFYAHHDSLYWHQCLVVQNRPTCLPPKRIKQLIINRLGWKVCGCQRHNGTKNIMLTTARFYMIIFFLAVVSTWFIQPWICCGCILHWFRKHHCSINVILVFTHTARVPQKRFGCGELADDVYTVMDFSGEFC